jgi:hypothetical protein
MAKHAGKRFCVIVAGDDSAAGRLYAACGRGLSCAAISARRDHKPPQLCFQVLAVTAVGVRWQGGQHHLKLRSAPINLG